MDFKKFSIRVVIRVLIILGLALLIAYFAFKQDGNQLIFTIFVFACLLSIAVGEMIWFVNRTNRELSKFLLAIKHADYSIYFPEEKKKGYLTELYKAFNSIIDSFKQLSGEKNVQNELLHQILSQIKIGIICTNGKNDIVLMNEAAENFLGAFKTKTWFQLKAKATSFTSKIDELEQGGSNIIDIESGSKPRQLFVQVNHSRLFNEPHRIITFQDIKQEINQKESEAWIRLIRILNHEIMNSVTPISSLTETILMILGQDEDNVDTESLDQEQISDVIKSVKTIQNRSDGLYNFVTEYRKLTKIPAPKLEEVLVLDLLKNVYQLWKSELEKNNIKGEFQISDQDLQIYVDPNLIEQVLINLLKNAIQAMSDVETPLLTLTAYEEDDRTVKIEVSDNGCGIPAKLLDDIFVPFFSTKEQGSGIGLSLARQIMRMHNGNISVESVPEEGTTISLSF